MEELTICAIGTALKIIHFSVLNRRFLIRGVMANSLKSLNLMLLLRTVFWGFCVIHFLTFTTNYFIIKVYNYF
jgi:hypothetical protein